MKMQTVAVLGVSPKPERYANKAIKMLKKHGHIVLPVTPHHSHIDGLKTFPTLADISQKIDTLTVYIGPKNMTDLIPGIIALNPVRVILNPGTESDELMAALKAASIPYLEACTLVMLSTDQF